MRDVSHHDINVVFDPFGGNAQDAVTLRGQPFVALQVTKGDISDVMHAPIDLDNQFCGMAGEIDHTGTDRRLPTKARLKPAQMLPEKRLGPGGRRTKSARTKNPAFPDLRRSGEPIDGVFRADRRGSAFTPIPNPSPLEGEGSMTVLLDH